MEQLIIPFSLRTFTYCVSSLLESGTHQNIFLKNK